MAITRRQFVATLGSMAAALGLSQADLAKVTESFALSGVWAGGKPKVIWVHGAECTGCSTSLLSLFEDARENAIVDTREAGFGTTVLSALGLVADGAVPRTLEGATIGGNPDVAPNANGAYVVNIADVLVDFLDLQYHETVMGPGGDLAYNMLNDNMENADAGSPFVLVVEGAVQVFEDGGAWNKPGVEGTDAPWCSIGMNADGTDELSFDKVVAKLASKTQCLAVVGIGQCACYGGYPAAVSPNVQFAGKSQTPAYGVYDFLASHSSHHIPLPADRAKAAGKVINCPGCPTNPWWFVLTVVLFLVDAVTGPLKGGNGVLGIVKSDWSLNGSAVDYGRRLKKVYGVSIHGPSCPRYSSYTGGKFAAKPGDSGCLLKLGCKGVSTRSLCAAHGWNSQQPQNDVAWENGLSQFQGANKGTFCVSAGHPCMGCTEKGYPDAQVPFMKLF